MSSHKTPKPRTNDGPEATFAQVDRLGTLLVELADLLQGSLRLVDHAKSAISSNAGLLGTAGVTDLERDISGAADRLEKMNELVHAAMQSANRPLGSPLLTRGRPVTLGEAIQHASEVLTPLARERRVAIIINGAPETDRLPAGALYTVILNAVQNAIEAVMYRGGDGGAVEISVRPDSAPGVGYGRDGRDWYILEIADDGVGPPRDNARCFDLGFSTKPKGAGVGLAVARSVVQGMGGTIELANRDGGGAVLRVHFPALANGAGRTLGGAA